MSPADPETGKGGKGAKGGKRAAQQAAVAGGAAARAGEPPDVTIAGGGMAGLTAALRLAERGYRVKLYEQKEMLGGNVASRKRFNGAQLDVYPHMYCNWYRNFWRLLEDVTPLDREQQFAPYSTMKLLSPGPGAPYKQLTGTPSLGSLMKNMLSGAGPMPDMFVYGYAGVDLLAERLSPTIAVDDVSVSGFLGARPYMTKRAAEAFDNFITRIWAIPSYLTSAEDYREYVAYSYAGTGPTMWMARGSAAECVIDPIRRALEKHRVEIVTNEQICSITRTDGRVSEIALQPAAFNPRTYEWEPAAPGPERGKWVFPPEVQPRTEAVKELLLAVPPYVLSQLIRSGPEGQRVVEAAPQLAETARLRSEAIPILHLYFTRTLPRIPSQPVGLVDSQYDLSFTDVSQAWQNINRFEGRTVLSVSASAPWGLPGTIPPERSDGQAILVELARYLDFDPGAEWGESRDIDWVATRYYRNRDAKLFVNETGTDAWRPRASCEGVSNLTFAGDFCANRIGMTTIESAVTTGLEAVREIVRRHGGGPVEIADPPARPDILWVWLRYAWAPYAYAAKAWSVLEEAGGRGRSRERGSLWSYLLTPTCAPRRDRGGPAGPGRA